MRGKRGTFAYGFEAGKKWEHQRIFNRPHSPSDPAFRFPNDFGIDRLIDGWRGAVAATTEHFAWISPWPAEDGSVCLHIPHTDWMRRFSPEEGSWHEAWHDEPSTTASRERWEMPHGA